MLVDDSFELFERLQKLDLLHHSPPYWWPAYGTFEVVVGAILTQNTHWSRVELSLENLRQNNLLSLNTLAQCTSEVAKEFIRPSGLFNAKATYLVALARAIREHFSNFETFVDAVDRTWLLSQKGVGPETADSILCYGCQRPIMVVDSYTARLLKPFGYEFESYKDLQTWCEAGLHRHCTPTQLPTIFAHFHGMIVEYVKANSHKKEVSIALLTHQNF